MGLKNFLLNFINTLISDTVNSTPQGLKTDTIEEIEAITIPRYKPLQGIESPVNNVEYILQRRATEHKKNGRMDLAIACLRKANEIMPHSNFTYAKNDYMRLVEYLKQDGQFEAAREEEAKLKSALPQVFSTSHTNFFSIIDRCKKSNSDLIIAMPHNIMCSICSAHTERIYSISGKDKRFPALPKNVFTYGGFHEGCSCSFGVYFEGVSTFNYHKDPVIWSNRPFVDRRTKEQIEMYEKVKKTSEQEVRDREDYDWLRENMPDIAPKSFGGYRKMKNSSSQNYIKLVSAAADKGYIIK